MLAYPKQECAMNTKRLLSLFTLYISLVSFAHAIQVPGPLVDSAWVNSNLSNITVLDLRADLKSFTRKPVYKKNKKTGKQKLIKIGGHIPGATLVNYKKIRTTNVIDGKKVQKMSPDKTVFEKIMQQSGLNQDSAVVIVSKGQSNADMTIAARLYWQLKYFGHDNMAILDGGMAQWILDGRKIAFDKSSPGKGNWRASAERNEILATTEDVKKAIDDKSVQLIDNRPIDLYLGTWKKSYVYSKGHIPGGKLWPNAVLTSHGVPARFLPDEQVRELTKGLGIDTAKPTITYCNSGQLAAGGWFVMHELLGNKNVKLYDGSMHEWTLRKQPVKALVME